MQKYKQETVMAIFRDTPHTQAGRAAAHRARRGLSKAVLATLFYTAFAGSALSQAYPSKPITIVVPSSAGAPSDLIGRMVAKSLATQSQGAVVVDDKPGANGIIGVQQVANAPADGHTLLFTTLSPIALNKHLFKSLPYDAQKDFVPIAVMARSTMFLSVNPRLPFRNAQELVAFAKREPAKLNFGYGTAVPQLAGSMFEQLAGVKFTFVPYKSHSAMVLALVSGEVDVSITDTASLAAYVKSGQVRPLASTAPARLAGYPDIPTLREAGVGYELVAWHGLFARRGTAPEVIARLTEWVKVAAKSPELHTYLAGNAIDDFLLTGIEAENYVNQDIKRWGQITADAGVKPN